MATPFIIKRRKFILDLKKIDKFRALHGLNKTALARQMFVIQTVVSYIYRAAPVIWAPEIAKVFGVDGKDLIKEIEVQEEIKNIDLLNFNAPRRYRWKDKKRGIV